MGVRWDEVVKQDDTFWSARRAVPAVPAVPNTAPAEGAPKEVRVYLFGMLAGPEVKSPLVLQLGGGFTLGDAISELGRRLGPVLLRSIVRENGEIISTCHVFVDGIPATDMMTPISGGKSPATVEIILLREIESG